MSLSRRSLVKLGLGAGVSAGVASALPRVADGAWRGHGAGPGAAPDVAGSAGRIRARALPLSAVRLRGGPLGDAQQKDAAWLLSLDPDRMLAPYRTLAGLPAKAEPLGGWDAGGRNLTGHIAGHYLSAISLMGAATGDARFHERARYMVDELKTVQDKQGDGLVAALEGARDCFGRVARGEIRSSAFDLNGQWSPWYTLHKTFAGLRDAYRFAGVTTALDVEKGFAGWVEGIVSPLDDAQVQHMLNTEFGGMNEVMVDLYEDTGDERWLRLSYRFEHTSFLEPLRRGQDDLADKHANTQIPKIVGSADRYVLRGDPADLLAATFFWSEVAHRHSFASGGHGTDEYFGRPGRLSDRVDGRTAESCNVYNMLKLTRRLFEISPDTAYADFHERALYNHALASFDLGSGAMCYMVPVGRGVTREYQDMEHDFTCCVGTGMENHALHGHGLYYESGDRLWVSQYATSTAAWAAAGVRLTMDTDFPLGEGVTLRLDADAPRPFTLSLRRPYWARDGFTVRVNGEKVSEPMSWAEAQAAAAPSGGGSAGGTDAPAGASARRPDTDLYAWDVPVSDWVDITRTWKSGDVVEVTLPGSLRLEATPDEPTRAALLWGPLVLAGDLGPEPDARRLEGEGANPAAMPVLVRDADGPVSGWVRPSGPEPGAFRTVDAGREPTPEGAAHDVELWPFYRLQHRTYAAYWDVFTPEEWKAKKTEYAAEAERRRKLEAATVAWIQPGEVVFERRFGYQGSGVEAARIEGHPGRRGRGSFSYDVPVRGAAPLTLMLTVFSDDRRAAPAAFDVLVDGTRVATREIGRGGPRRFYDLEIQLPAEATRGKDEVTLRFRAREGKWIPTLFGVRLVRADAMR